MDRAMDRLSVTEAAEVLGVTQAAIYKRIQRGTIAHDKDHDGHVFVYLDTSDIQADESMDSSTDTSGSPRDELIAELRSHNAHLRQEVADWKEEARRKDHLLAAALERIPAIEAPQEPSPETRDSDLTPFEQAAKGATPPGDTEPPRASWWQRWFGG
jgi:hypothetical protein